MTPERRGLGRGAFLLSAKPELCIYANPNSGCGEGWRMAMREFVDDKGVGWRVWSVAIDQVYSQGVRLDTLGDLQDGWLCFEAPSERRRLAGYPADWFRMPDEDLVELLSRAAPVLRRRPSGPVDLDPGES